MYIDFISLVQEMIIGGLVVNLTLVSLAPGISIN